MTTWPLWLSAMVLSWGVGWTMERGDRGGVVFYALLALVVASVALVADVFKHVH